jgi:peptidyl-prolyl cis-trans isomerase C
MRPSLFMFLFTLGCANGTASSAVPGEMAATGKTLVTVNGNAITQSMVDTMIQQMPDRMRKQMEATGQMGQLQEQLVIGEILYREALTQNLHQQDDVKSTIALATRSALAQALLDKVVKERTTDAAVQTYYADHKVQFARPQVNASHILVKEEALSKEIAAKLTAGGDFGALAKEHSMDPGSKTNGGSLGWFKKADMVGPFADAAFAAEKGTVTEPVQTRFGWHIIQVVDKRDEIPLEEVREEIEQAMSQELLQAYIDEIKTSAKIEQAGATDKADAKPVDAKTAKKAKAAKKAKGEKAAK